ncbi:hypothetical protein JW865_09475 [Candidatus Bathyarchaeota archaeon]|nr:hypothetical protein [Candidatus Bathyarchaeota archaeon]
MRKIFIVFGLLITSICVNAQYSMTTTLAQNFYQYKNYLENGSTIQAVRSYEKLIKGNTLYDLYIQGSLTGRSSIMDSAYTEFNALYGKTHSSPTISIGSLSYLNIDSLSFDGGSTYVYNILSESDVTSLINGDGVNVEVIDSLITAGSVDSTFLNNKLIIFRDSLDVTNDIRDSVIYWISEYFINAETYDTLKISTFNLFKNINNSYFNLSGDDGTISFLPNETTGDRIRGSDTSAYIEFGTTGVSIAYSGIDAKYNGGYFTIGDGADTLATQSYARLYSGSSQEQYSQDSTWGRITTDTIKLGTMDIYNPGGDVVKIRRGDGVGGINISPIQIYGLSSTSPLIDFVTPSSTDPVFIPNYNDGNTGYSWVSSGKLGLVSSSVSTFTSEYTSSKKINNLMDSAITTHLNAKRITTDSIHTLNGWHKNIVSYQDVPSYNSVRSVSPSGVLRWVNIDSLGLNSAILNPDSVAASDIIKMRIYNSTGEYFDNVDIISDTSFAQMYLGSSVTSATTINPSGDVFHVTGTTTIQTINLPRIGFVGEITIIFDSVAPLGTSGNIKTSLTPDIDTGYKLFYDGNKWYVIQ